MDATVFVDGRHELMKYAFARLVIFLVRVISWFLLVPSTLLFIWCLVLVVPPVVQNGFNAQTIANGRGGIKQQEEHNDEEAKEPPVFRELNMGTSEVSTGLLAGGVALGIMILCVALLTACDILKAIIDTARNTDQLLTHFRDRVS
jgi:hypothetical protein